jgi:hypothetical protein
MQAALSRDGSNRIRGRDVMLGLLALIASLAMLAPAVAGATPPWGTVCKAEFRNEGTEPPTLEPEPCLFIESATAVTETTATLHGVINPHGLSTTVYFEYQDEPLYEKYVEEGEEYEAPNHNHTLQTNEVTVSGSSNLSKSATISGLKPGTTYYARVESGKQLPPGVEGEVECDPICAESANEIYFTTLPAPSPPTVTTGAASNVGFSTATVAGTVNPNKRATTYYFEYGISLYYGSSTATSSAGDGGNAIPVQLNLSALKPGFTYHFRLVASNTAGSLVYGADASFVEGRYPQLFGAGDFSGDAAPDLIGAEPNGNLYLYLGNGKGGFGGGGQGQFIGEGFYPRFSTVFGVGDFNGDGHPDVMAEESNGNLYLYPGNGAGGFGNGGHGVFTGEGFNRFSSLASAGDFNGDGYPDVLAEEANGKLYLYPGTGTGGFGNGGHALLIGEGFNRYISVFGVGMFKGKKPDLIGVEANGKVFLYQGNGKGGFKTGVGELIGEGFNRYTSVFSAGDFDGDKNQDLIGVERPGGFLFLYSGDGKGGFKNGGHGVLIGEGF